MLNRNVDVVIGMQYGSEGKGKMAAWLSENIDYYASVRVGAWQAGHTVYYDGKKFKMQLVPCGWIDVKQKLVLGAGALINMEVLTREINAIEELGVPIRERLIVDYRAIIGNGEHSQREKDNQLFEKIGSTTEGIGACRVDKIERKGKAIRVADCMDKFRELGVAVEDTVSLLHTWNKYDKPILLEGTQGCHLSITTSKYYPQCTSSDPNVAGILSDAGISPFTVRDVYGVIRTYPIRVAGNSGDTGGKEITWSEVQRRSGSPDEIIEKTTVTNRVRRVFEFSPEDVVEAIKINTPTKLCLTFADYINYKDFKTTRQSDLSSRTIARIHDIEHMIGQKIDFISTGPKNEDMIQVRSARPRLDTSEQMQNLRDTFIGVGSL